MLQIIEGARPKKPKFVTTRGYTEELWQLSTACWGDPTGRPTAGEVLVALGSAAEQWAAKPGYVPQDDWSPTSTEEYSPLTVRSSELEGLKIHSTLPDSYIILDSEIQKLGNSPVSGGGFSKVWRGTYGRDRSIAIKVMRHDGSGYSEKMKKVRNFDLSPRSSPTIQYRTSAGRSKPGNVYLTRTYWS